MVPPDASPRSALSPSGNARPRDGSDLGGPDTANAAWVADTVIAFNLARAACVVAEMRLARWASLRTRLTHPPGRIATTSRRQVLHLPQWWPW